MDQQWKIMLYESTVGAKPVEEFIKSLEEKGQAKVHNTIELLKEYGIRLGPPHSRKLSGTSLWELRILGSDSTRIFYVAISSQTFLLLHGFKKKTQKAPIKEIRIAQNRLHEFQARQRS